MGFDCLVLNYIDPWGIVLCFLYTDEKRSNECFDYEIDVIIVLEDGFSLGKDHVNDSRVRAFQYDG
jgi:hypothetical protein